VGLVRVIALVKEQVSAKFLDGALCQNITDNKDAVEKVQTAMVTMFDELSSKFDHLRNDLEQVTEGQTIVRKTRLPSPPVRKFKLAYNK
jgi:hypothetical protein